MIQANINTVIKQCYRLENEDAPGRFYYPTYVNAYEVERVFGGHEEGGWWYDYQTPLCTIRVKTIAQAIKAYDLMLEIYGPDFDDNIPLSSVGSYGDLRIYVEDEVGKNTEPQHYE
jgi:hypothetical protein